METLKIIIAVLGGLSLLGMFLLPIGMVYESRKRHKAFMRRMRGEGHGR